MEQGSSESAIEDFISSNNDVGEDITDEVKAALKSGCDNGVFFKNKAGLFKVQKQKKAPAAKKTPAAPKGKGKGKKAGKRNNKKKVLLFRDTPSFCKIVGNFVDN